MREQLRKEARTAQLFVAARNGGQALVRAATCSETVVGRAKQTTVKLDSTASSFYTVTADVFLIARSAETRKLLEKRVFEGFPVELAPGLELARTSRAAHRWRI